MKPFYELIFNYCCAFSLGLTSIFTILQWTIIYRPKTVANFFQYSLLVLIQCIFLFVPFTTFVDISEDTEQLTARNVFQIFQNYTLRAIGLILIGLLQFPLFSQQYWSMWDNSVLGFCSFVNIILGAILGIFLLYELIQRKKEDFIKAKQATVKKEYIRRSKWESIINEPVQQQTQQNMNYTQNIIS